MPTLFSVRSLPGTLPSEIPGLARQSPQVGPCCVFSGRLGPLPGFGPVRQKRPVFLLFRGRYRSFLLFHSLFLHFFRHRLARAECDDTLFRDIDGFAGQWISRLVGGPTLYLKDAEVP